MFSKTCKYAIRAVLYLAIYTDETKKLGVEQIAEGLGVPKHFLAKILQELTRKKLASSTKGRNGGFYLTDKNKEASLLPVIQSIEGPEAFKTCVLGLPNCSNEKPCSFHEQAVSFRHMMLGILEEESIAETAARVSSRKFKL